MIEQIGVALPTQVYFSTLGIGTESLIVTVDVRRNGVLIVTGASVPEIGGGFYGYTLDASYNTAEGIYTFLFKTATVTVDQQQLVGAWYVGKAGVEFLDASIAAIPSAPTTAEIWANAERTLTMTAAQVADIVAGDEITITNSATITIALTGLGSLSGATQIWFCAKRNKDADDESARFHVALNGGLLRTNGSAGVAGDGTLVVDNATTGNITVTVKPASAKLIAGGTEMHWGVKVKFSDDLVHELSSGVINIVQAITHSV